MLREYPRRLLCGYGGTHQHEEVKGEPGPRLRLLQAMSRGLTPAEAKEAFGLWKKEEPKFYQKHMGEHQEHSDTGMWLGTGEPEAEYECIFCQLEYEAGERAAP